jgi:hypothetical protein
VRAIELEIGKFEDPRGDLIKRSETDAVLVGRDMPLAKGTSNLGSLLF